VIPRRPLIGPLAALLATVATGCHSRLPEAALVLTQTPFGAQPATPRDLLDQRYPLGSRVVLALPPLDPAHVRVLSRGLVAAGDPVVSADGDRVFFNGRGPNGEEWQIYEADLAGGRPTPVTVMPGGAAGAALLSDGAVVFSSPVPRGA